MHYPLLDITVTSLRDVSAWHGNAIFRDCIISLRSFILNGLQSENYNLQFTVFNLILHVSAISCPKMSVSVQLGGKLIENSYSKRTE